jgi:glycine/D-amino acid oxidase-like deaminating enzyme/nitrite reductase/ring-hydroxylating ferredoxin subunit
MIDRSLWRDRSIPTFGAADLPREVDVAIVGGGITGLSAAYLLKQAGKRVAVFDRERIGAGESGNTSAHLTMVTDLRLLQLVDRFGRDAARLVWQGGATALDVIELNVRTAGIACGFQRVPGFVCAPFTGDPPGADETKSLVDEAACASELGFAAQYVNRGPVTGRPAVAYADQALFHPIDYVTGLALAVNGDGSVVCDGADVAGVIQDPLAVNVNGQTIACQDVVIATHVPIMGSSGMASAMLLQTKLYPYSTYVLGARVADDAPEPGLYFDISDPYFYLRIHETTGGRYAIFGGMDHKTGQASDTEARFAQLESTLHSLIPSARIDHRWTGQVVQTADGLPYVGRTADHQYAATGYAGNGLTFGTLAGLMIRDAIMGARNPWQGLFDIHRKPTTVSALATLLGENVDYPYYYIKDRLLGGDGSGVENVPRGGGKVVTLDGKRVACHRTKDGDVIKVSAVCTHMGCLVRWNEADATWDCPCHGSRFTPEGLVIGGPAESPLERIE